MKTLLTIAQQNAFIANNWKLETLAHVWSARGMGASRIQNARGETLARATGCGYDRFGTAIGQFIEATFPDELERLAKRFCKTKYGNGGKSSKAFYGLFVNSDGKVYLDGGCGHNCIGFELKQSGEHKTTNSGNVFYVMRPVSYDTKKYIVSNIK